MPADRPNPATSAESSRTTRRPAAKRGQGDKLRAEIIDVATRLLEETGEPSRLSLRRIAREVGVTATSIYLHFDSLDELVSTVKMQSFDVLTRELEDAASSANGDATTQMRAFANAYVDFGLRHPGLYQAWFTSEMSAPPTESTQAYIGESTFTLVRGRLAALIGSEDADLFTVQLWCALHGVVMLRTNRSTFPWPALDRQLDDLVTRLLPRT